MQGRKSAIKITLDEPIREKLTQWLRAQKTPLGVAKRAATLLNSESKERSAA